jgi:hypothetical protein
MTQRTRRARPDSRIAPVTTKPPSDSAATTPASHWPANCFKRSFHVLRDLGDQTLQPAWSSSVVGARGPSRPDAPRPAPACCCPTQE